jgi:hypothetical protein
MCGAAGPALRVSSAPDQLRCLGEGIYMVHFSPAPPLAASGRPTTSLLVCNGLCVLSVG